jgi:hypothetical protein
MATPEWRSARASFTISETKGSAAIASYSHEAHPDAPPLEVTAIFRDLALPKGVPPSSPPELMPFPIRQHLVLSEELFRSSDDACYQISSRLQVIPVRSPIARGSFMLDGPAPARHIVIERLRDEHIELHLPKDGTPHVPLQLSFPENQIHNWDATWEIQTHQGGGLQFLVEKDLDSPACLDALYFDPEVVAKTVQVRRTTTYWMSWIFIFPRANSI